VYIGAPNVLEFVPGPRSMVHIRDFPTGKALWEYLLRFEDDAASAAQYAEFFAWKPHAMLTTMEDERGVIADLGTGLGVAYSQLMPRDKLAAQLQLWQPIADTSDPTKVSTFDEAKAGAAAVAGSKTFEELCMATWRNFRRQLDRCVHYAECRLCELVSLLT
jgi:hypothetical protein